MKRRAMRLCVTVCGEAKVIGRSKGPASLSLFFFYFFSSQTLSILIVRLPHFPDDR